ncbi:MAG: ribonucleoside triphosphate reductase [Candidatus Dojkabacteria bacterium]
MTFHGRTDKSEVEVFKIVEEYLNGTDWRVNEDSNKTYSLHGLSNHIATTLQANYWLNRIYPTEIKDAHVNGDFHIHDLGYISTYCCGWDLQEFLMKGFRGVPGCVTMNPPKHLDAALNQLVHLLYTLRHEAAGAQAVSSLDTYMAPFIRYDNLSYEEVRQILQGFIYSMNIPLDKGFQVPFTNVTLDIRATGSLAEESVIIGGVRQKEQYKDFEKEMLIFNRAFADVMTEGDSTGRVFTWPIPTYNITKDFPWDEPELEPIWKMTAKYGIPYFSNFINSDMKPDDVRSMCCRLRIDNRELQKRGGGLFGSNPLTGSIGVVTINVAKIGYLAKSKKDFMKRLRHLMDLAKESLMIKRGVIEEMTERGLYPYSRFYLSSIKERFGKYWKNHFNTIGLLGMNEACLNFLGKGIKTEKGREFALEVMDYMRETMSEYQDATGEIFNLEATPGESAAYRFAKADRRIYNDIIVANQSSLDADPTTAPYYTNSTQLPPYTTDDIFEALDHQDELQCKYTGGTVVHLFLGQQINDVATTKALVKKIATNYKLPYYSITPTFSICPKHGYLPGEHEYCPKCDIEIGYTDEQKESTNVSQDFIQGKSNFAI